jgi:hypothetical protein
MDSDDVISSFANRSPFAARPDHSHRFDEGKKAGPLHHHSGTGTANAADPVDGVNDIHFIKRCRPPTHFQCRHQILRRRTERLSKECPRFRSP